MSSCEVDENYEDFNTKPSCRICYSSRENLISSPCNCIGTLGYVHQSCFLRWIANIKKFDKCEICHQKYHASSLPQRSFWKLFKAFFPQPFFALCKFSVNFLLATGAGLLLSVKLHDFSFNTKIRTELLMGETSTFYSSLLTCVPMAIFYGFAIEQTFLSFGKLLERMDEWWHYNWRAIRISSDDENFMVFMDVNNHNLNRRDSTTMNIAIVDDVDMDRI